MLSKENMNKMRDFQKEKKIWAWANFQKKFIFLTHEVIIIIHLYLIINLFIF